MLKIVYSFTFIDAVLVSTKQPFNCVLWVLCVELKHTSDSDLLISHSFWQSKWQMFWGLELQKSSIKKKKKDIKEKWLSWMTN